MQRHLSGRILSAPVWALAAALVIALPMLAGAAPPAGHSVVSALPTRAKTSVQAASKSPVRLGPTDPSQPISVTLSLQGSAPAALAQTLAAIHNPLSPEYHHYLTPDQFAQRFGASQAEQSQVSAALQAGGLVPGAITSGSLLLSASGTVGQVEALFGVKLGNYRDAQGHVYYASESAPQLPTVMQGQVVGVLGLDDQPLIHRDEVLAPKRASADAPPPQPLGPLGIQDAYDITPLITSGLNGSGQTMAFAEIDTFKQGDITAYDAQCGDPRISCSAPISAPAVEVVKVDGGSDPAQDISETTLDIEVAHAIAPQTHLIAYEGSADFSGLTDTFSKIVTDDRAQVVSISLGGCETAIAQDPDLGQSFFNTLDTIFQRASLQGMTVVVAAGDNGAYTCVQNDPSSTTPAVSVPADSPYVTAVGGTSLFVDQSSSSYSYAYEAGWEAPLEEAGGGGGVSVAYSIPAWQTGNGVSNSYSNGMRQIPDVSASADPMTGYTVYDSTTPCSGSDCWTAVGGTSAAAPLWGALVVLANQSAEQSGKGPMGFINNALYAMGRGELGQSPFHDVTTGGNLYYPATTGWDFSTGWGSPDAAALVKDLVSQAPSK